MRPLRRGRTEDPLAGKLDPEYPPQPSGVHPPAEPVPESAQAPDEAEFVERPPSVMRRMRKSLGEVRRRILPLPDEVIEEFLGNGERMIHNDHPSFRSFVVENTLLFVGFLVLGVLFLGITFNGSLIAAGLILLVLSVVLLLLVLRRLGDRYTSYVVTDTRIMQISGVISRRAHSIPWVRVTDLTIEQSLMGRLFGYATLHIESANEDSGLRDLEGVSDPMQFNQYVVDMVVAKQGPTEPHWERTGEPPPVAMGRGLRRLRMARRLRGAEGDEHDEHEGDEGSTSGGGSSLSQIYAGDAGRTSHVAPFAPVDDGEFADLDAETLARRLESSGESDLPWRQ